MAAASVIVALLLAMAIFLYSIAAGAFKETDAAAKMIAAVLMLLGILTTALLTFAGVLLKNSLDRRAEARFQLEAERNIALHQEAEARLKLEAAIRAVQLLATPTGDSSQPIQRTGALFTLCSLGQYELVLALVHNLLALGQIESVAATGVLNEILIHGSESLQAKAMTVLNNYYQRMLDDTGFDLPDCLMNGCSSNSIYVRDWLPIVIANIAMARPKAEWTSAASSSLVAALAAAWEDEVDVRIKSDMAAILRVLIGVFYPLPVFLKSPYREHRLRAISDAIANVSAYSATVQQKANELDEWAKQSS